MCVFLFDLDRNSNIYAERNLKIKEIGVGLDVEIEEGGEERIHLNKIKAELRNWAIKFVIQLLNLHR